MMWRRLEAGVDAAGSWWCVRWIWEAVAVGVLEDDATSRVVGVEPIPGVRNVGVVIDCVDCVFDRPCDGLVRMRGLEFLEMAGVEQVWDGRVGKCAAEHLCCKGVGGCDETGKRVVGICVGICGVGGVGDGWSRIRMSGSC